MTAGDFPSDDGDWQPDAESLNALEAEIPTLAVLRSFADEACRQPWFTELGEALDPSIKSLAQGYLDGLGYPDAEAAPMMNWDDALDAALSLDINSAGWEAEEQLRAALVDAALTRVSEEGLGGLLAHLAALSYESLQTRAGEMIHDMSNDGAPSKALRPLQALEFEWSSKGAEAFGQQQAKQQP